MILRHHLLQEPHMASLRDHPALDAMPDGQLQALETFMSFCADHRVANPGKADIGAFVRLRDQAPAALRDLSGAFYRIGLGKGLLDKVDATHAARAHKATFDGIPKGSTRTHTRTVSLPVEELPMAWQTTLRRLDLEDKYSPSILERMKGRLGMFAWSAEQAGRPVDLADTAALRTFYENMKARSIKRQREKAARQGLDDDIAEPRWAYLRSAWEEMRRFAQHHGLPDGVRDKLNVTYSHLVEKEGRQAAEKVRKAKTAGTRPELLKKAEAMLAKAETLPLPQMRHAMRNRAAAIALGCAVPARPADVQAHHVLGVGIAFEPARNSYRFTYKAGKTAGTTGADIDIPLLPWWNKFLDALILQDDDPRYLGPLRTKALSEKRPLYVHYDDTPACYAWYSRMWLTVTGTGGHIARALVYDEPGAAGILYGSVVNGHKPGSSVVRKYETEALGKARVLEAQATMAMLFDDDEE
ncbi:hypothetical protein A8B81_16595 [Sulfitobacter pontiacus]|uniref:hypothetical protein n=1 Tax=Sulfitobacter pontiacus TaxID=60137 RepID=UPI0007D90B21|nr:hypothetical protein [Sulfitobacter pontiacus]OAN75463.1 hypothetical protein A8B81_16595 [Sulfitobacter pontiacus]